MVKMYQFQYSELTAKMKKLKIDITPAGSSTITEEFDRAGDWLKLERVGNLLKVHTSHDGQTWAILREVNLPMLNDAYMGVISRSAQASMEIDYQVPNDNIFYLYTDHLNSVTVISGNASKSRVWQRDDFELGASAFGQNDLANGRKLHNGAFEMPLRFPGQYYDQETGTHYNYFRDYDPSIGRYVQSDPVGLNGGTNTYLYANANSLVEKDIFGLWATDAHNENFAAGIY